ncbi:MAG: ABC transporter permease [Anaerolineae bacterium]|nr:ABC transporter permease [Candidatus Roseilinea sp.]MDW8448426.1 ABC transporter permease [Anaerolineae bacterium]
METLRQELLSRTPLQSDEPSHLRELIEARDLLFIWVRREFRVRYSQSVMGAAWAVLQPLALMAIFSLVFGFVLRVPTEGVPYPVFSYVGSLAWTFFAGALTFAIPSLVNNMSLVSKIYFPREILPLSAVLVCLVDFVIAAVLLIPLMLLSGVELRWTIALLPLIVIIQVLLSYGLSLIGSAVNVFFRDVRFVIPLALQIWLYASPVIYPVSAVPESLRTVYFLNPMSVLIDSYRRVILFGQLPDWGWLGFTAIVSIAVLILGYGFFKRAESRFADLI